MCSVVGEKSDNACLHAIPGSVHLQFARYTVRTETSALRPVSLENAATTRSPARPKPLIPVVLYLLSEFYHVHVLQTLCHTAPYGIPSFCLPPKLWDHSIVGGSVRDWEAFCETSPIEESAKKQFNTKNSTNTGADLLESVLVRRVAPIAIGT